MRKKCFFACAVQRSISSQTDLRLWRISILAVDAALRH
jgi:hypothetical protein